VKVDGADITDSLRTPEVAARVSPVAAHAELRFVLDALMRRLSEGRDMVVEGRDMGTVVFPDAEFKFYVTATLEERARRRSADWRSRGHEMTDEEAMERVVARDETDSNRAVAPLRPADDARHVDTTERSVEEVLDELVAVVGGD